MKSKKEYLILGGIIILLALYLVSHKKDRTFYELPKLPEVKKADITTLKITKADHTIELQKKDDKWIILPEKYPADSAKIDPMLDIITGLTVTAMVSESDNYNRYGLDDPKKINILALAGDKPVRSFDVGKAAPSNQQTFIKLTDDKRVYHARENFKTKFDVTTDALRDLTVMAFDKTQIQQIEILAKEKKPLILSMKQAPVEAAVKPEKQPAEAPEAKAAEETASPEAETPEKESAPKNIWQAADGATMQESDVNSLLDGVSKLKCKEFIKDKTKADFTSPIYTVKLHLGDKTYELSVFDKVKKDDNTYPAVSSENESPFLLPQYKVEDLINKFSK
jgi:cell division septation protein DedD